MERLGFFGKRLITFDSTSFKHVGGHHYFFPGNRKRNQGRTWAGEKEAGSRLITFTPDNSPGAERSGGTMDIGSAILIIGLAALAAAFLLLVIGLVYSELMNSDVPRGVANSSKLHMVHGLFVGIAIVVSNICGIISAHYLMFPACFWICYNWLFYYFMNLFLSVAENASARVTRIFQAVVRDVCPSFVLQSDKVR